MSFINYLLSIINNYMLHCPCCDHVIYVFSHFLMFLYKLHALSGFPIDVPIRK